MRRMTSVPWVSTRAPFRSRWRSMATLVACLAFAGPAFAQPRGQPDDPGVEHQTPSVEHREPWPLRPDPTPGAEETGCAAGAHYTFRIGAPALRLGPGIRWNGNPAEPRPPTWVSDLPPCGDGRTIPVQWLYLDFGSFTGLPRGCWAAGIPPGPGGPACAATPEGLRAGRRYFALGLPSDITFDA
jgi:hypothetical protein